MRGNGFRPNKTAVVNGTPLEYILPTTEVLAFGMALKQGSTMGGHIGLANTTIAGGPEFIGFKATTGDSTVPIPALRLGVAGGANYELIAPAASSETVVSTTQVGNHIAFSSSGTALCAATTGQFVISGVYNTSSVAAQYFTGHFIGAATTA